ncbi:transglutaminase domain protein [Acidimicrobium ferrooxidans DSM 10331]|uniref:Transglutaminase domain protein n=1 Tax=Acidimicrobium ferrooxidans (strain DSM 10331 / JCM 15462 / NBRC 103882 / ICP) TaxID=525909 RepID=C7M0S8_ACIFD|nr:transglutaminase family protein [Acidimicrobium ferrooxidans]ACU54586.1 transglutaminase domain protein [Acidimicrobium ferrooxidans DSM 10331]
MRRSRSTLATWHTTELSYDTPAVRSYSELRMSPTTGSSQRVLRHRIELSQPAHRVRYRDYWGSVVTYFDIQRPHSELTIVASSTVRCAPWSTGSVVTLATLARPETQRALLEYLLPTPLTTIAEPAIDLEVGTDPLERAEALAAIVHDTITYAPGTTTVDTTADEAWARRSGVCQDATHVLCALLRHAGIPARYVSGCFAPHALEVSEAAEGASHAWVEAWVGHWHPLDPTNLFAPSERYITVARGRDYRDVAPLHGIYEGPGRQTMRSSVRIQRVS